MSQASSRCRLHAWHRQPTKPSRRGTGLVHDAPSRRRLRPASIHIAGVPSNAPRGGNRATCPSRSRARAALRGREAGRQASSHRARRDVDRLRLRLVTRRCMSVAARDTSRVFLRRRPGPVGVRRRRRRLIWAVRRQVVSLSARVRPGRRAWAWLPGVSEVAAKSRAFLYRRRYTVHAHRL
jgi:hypothetical protein